MEEDVRHTIEGIHDAPARCVLAVTGAGSRGIAWLLEVPGASNTLLDARIPYSEGALVDLLGERPRHFVSAETAAAMAASAYALALRLREGDSPVLGIGCTGALVTRRERRGAERVFVAVASEGEPACYALTFAKGKHSREEEEDVCSRLLIQALALRSGVLPAFAVPLLPGDSLSASGALSPAHDLLAARVSHLLLAPDGRFAPEGAWRGGALAGAFNPLHEGHRRLAEIASQLLGAGVAFELSVENVDKPPLSEEETLRRARQFLDFAPLLLTRAPTFREKSRILPGCTFVIGYDTAVRLVAPRYYAGEEDMLAALREIREHGCAFLVAGRLTEGAYRTLADVPIPREFQGMFREIPGSAFRLDISSTELRARGER